MNQTFGSRRVFLMQTATAALGTVLASQAHAQAMVAESESQDAALGYKADATKVDKTKQAKYAAG